MKYCLCNDPGTYYSRAMNISHYQHVFRRCKVQIFHGGFPQEASELERSLPATGHSRRCDSRRIVHPLYVMLLFANFAAENFRRFLSLLRDFLWFLISLSPLTLCADSFNLQTLPENRCFLWSGRVSWRRIHQSIRRGIH